MAKFSQKVKGKEIGQAAVYAEPHTMSGKTITMGTGYSTNYRADPNTMSAKESTPGGMPARRVSAGDPASTQINKNGEITMRGAGAATKGIKCRGPMG
jgi:hypothetical protein